MTSATVRTTPTGNGPAGEWPRAARQHAQRRPAERPAGPPQAARLTAEQVMSRVLVAVEPGESPLMAWELMRRADVHHLPVVEGRHVLGILTREDVAEAWSGGPREQSERQVGSLLAGRRRPRVGPGATLERVAAVMLDAGCDAVPVVRDGGLVGLITARDLLAAVAGRIEPRDEQDEPEIITGMFHLQPVLP
ncbi:CBS domain-containing protein [Nonomuraea sp. MCN248]|uniref:CBS domain-containing protein n=1 Tax=Nonomuraea corallina TaxID=2989783 RepID=A0ABT4SAG0_9ACTN|nr:CBS domain-containing protein [Nonomuraea corallina]MDA0634197.1 CBS domain-containing protein [Nonomuraea corallina]